MATFSKKHKISEVSNSYQITVTGSHEGRKAVVTKWANEKTWSVAKWYDDSKNNLSKADVVEEGFKKLSHAKDAAEFFVDLTF